MLHLLRDTQTHSCLLSTTQLVFMCFHPKDGTIVQSVILGKYLGRKGVYSFLIKLHVHLLQLLNTQYIVFPLFLFCFHSEEGIRYEKAYCSWESLATLEPYGHIDNYLILCYCRKLFHDKHPSVSKKHFFFPHVGVNFRYISYY
jgi:hypothetical protein